ncbi:MAG: response regulator [Candidatus Zapsychrus exili]|nr:response regulator [Candidatus Zapsychrus exili]
MFNKLNQIFNRKDLKIQANKGYSILVVEDNEVDRKIIHRTLESKGYNVLIAENGAIGLKMAKEHKPNLVLLDCEMPVMDGKEMCRRLKEDEDISKIPVVFLTGLTTPKNIIDCFDLELENYLSKPVKPGLLASQIEMILAENAAQ